MRLRPQKLFTLAALVSLLLCIGSAVLLVRTERVSARCSLNVFGRQFWFEACDGELQISDDPGTQFFIVLKTQDLTPEVYVPTSGERGYVLDPSNPSASQPQAWAYNGPPYHEWKIPLNAAVLLTGILPVVWLGRFHASRRRKSVQGIQTCRRCGYDLRATPERCPECGTVVKTQRRSQSTRLHRDR